MPRRAPHILHVTPAPQILQNSFFVSAHSASALQHTLTVQNKPSSELQLFPQCTGEKGTSAQLSVGSEQVVPFQKNHTWGHGDMATELGLA